MIFPSFMDSGSGSLIACSAKDRAAIWQSYAQVVALGLAGGYFILKALQGFFFADLQLDVKLSAGPVIGKDQRYLLVDVTLKRAAQGALNISDAIVAFTQDGHEYKPLPLGIRRFGSIEKDDIATIVLDSFPKRRKTLNLSPGDSTCLSVYQVIEDAKPCMVDVIVLGRQLMSPLRGQWRASASYVPNLISPRELSKDGDDMPY